MYGIRWHIVHIKYFENRSVGSKAGKRQAGWKSEI
jgi:hypothetical protein